MAENPVSLIGALMMGGAGAALGSIVTAVVQLIGHKGESRASAADLVTHAAGGLAAQQDKTIDRLERQSHRQRQALLGLAAVVDEMLDQLPIPVTERTKLQRAVNDARLAI